LTLESWLSGVPGCVANASISLFAYSMPACHALIEHGSSEKVLACNAGHVKNVPGRKTDFSDAEWLVHLLECGLLAGSFIPPAEVKAARDVLRYRAKVARQRVSELARLDVQIEAMMTPFQAARDLLITAPGIGPLSAAAVISEIGADVTGFFPDDAHLASWTGLCPGNHESAGRRRSGKRRKVGAWTPTARPAA
jgi:Transposase IS116/IS110/IS902 family